MIEAKNGARALVVNAMGRVFMDPLDDPSLRSTRADGVPAAVRRRRHLIDFHGEAASEKQAMGIFCDGRASLVVGTHTHVRPPICGVLPGGTAYMSDVGMVGDFDSVIGMGKDEPLQRFTRKIFLGAVRAGDRGGDAMRGRGRNRAERACGAGRAGAARPADWNRLSPRSGLSFRRAALYKTAAINASHARARAAR